MELNLSASWSEPADLPPHPEEGVQKENMITLHWHPDKQIVTMDFNRKSFKTWAFVLSVIEMAKTVADEQRQAAVAMALQQQMHAQQLAVHALGRGQNNGSRIIR